MKSEPAEFWDRKILQLLRRPDLSFGCVAYCLPDEIEAVK